ncbi:MAG: (2,3-dihydroxybenzoyl)adenylate synthase [Solirubrobacteraceae bacterium]|nr:(2,3-dihydroxybenzoyl)adenylate synthase [Solirubrobacteraceae bacterium]
MSDTERLGTTLDARDVVPWPPALAARWRALGYWRGETFGSMLRERAVARPDHVAVVAGRERWTYGELDDRADRLAVGLRTLGIAAGDRVVLQLGNVAEFAEVCFALLRIGALPVFALPPHRHAEIAYFCAHAEATAYVIGLPDGRFDPRDLAAEVQATVPALEHVIVAGDAATPAAASRPFVALDDLRTTGEPDRGRIDAHAEGGGWAPRSSDVALLQLSGGSTGVPKLIPRTHDEYLYTLRRSAELCGLTPDGVYLAVLPVAHNYPLSSPGIMGTLYAGGRVVLAPDPSPATALPLIERERVTITGVVPPLALTWLDAVAGSRAGRDDLTSLAVLQVGGAKLSAAVARRVRPTLGCTLQQVFGMAEGLVSYTRLDDDEQTIVTTQGRPMAEHDELRVVDDDDRDLPLGATGHLLTRGPYTIRGYYRAPVHNARAFTPGGWYRTGDLVRLTPEGGIVVEGREKDQINRGGEKVAAEEIENHLLAHPAVHDAAVVAMPDPYLDERTCAFVVPRGDAAVDGPALRRFVRERGVAAFKVPDRVEQIGALPRTNVGKVSKQDLRAEIVRRLSRPAED